MEILEKIAYLKGLADGMDLKAEKSKESKLLIQLLDVLEDIGLELQDMQEEQSDLEEGLDAVSDDLSEVESFLYGEDDEDDECCDGEDCCCGEDDEDECYETVCPNCEEHIYFDDSVLEDGAVTCPNCGENLEFDLSDLEDASGEDEEE